MTTAADIYNRFLIMANSLDTSSNIYTEKARFVLLFNQTAKEWARENIKNVKDADIVDFQFLLTEPVTLKEVKKTDTYYLYELPADYLRWANYFSVASKETCQNIVIYNHLAKPQNLSVQLSDGYNTPSFEYEHIPINFSTDHMQSYYSDFTITGQFLAYYSNPKPIDIAGSILSNGMQSSNIDSDMPDWAITQILKQCVTSSFINSGNVQNAQLSTLNSQIKN